jgi:hypothetical protein
VFVAHFVQGRQHVAGEFSGFLQHCRGDVAVEVAVMARLHGRLQASAMVEREQDVGDRRAVSHDDNLALTETGLPYSHETGVVSTLRWAVSGRARGVKPAGVFASAVLL